LVGALCLIKIFEKKQEISSAGLSCAAVIFLDRRSQWNSENSDVRFSPERALCLQSLPTKISVYRHLTFIGAG